jgi:hypothetical protein
MKSSRMITSRIDQMGIALVAATKSLHERISARKT